MHPVDQFRQELARLDRYPTGVVPVPRPIDGTAFFAAGSGLYCESPPSIAGLPRFPFDGVMFVGHNLDAEGPYHRRLELGIAHGDRLRPMRTWRGLYQLLDTAELAASECYFTNGYVGLVAGDKPTGLFPGALDAQFSSWCQRFLRFQLLAMKPTVIATIGAEARRFVGLLSSGLHAWRRGPSMSVNRAEIEGHRFAAIALAHPSMYPASARHRSFQGERGMRADAALLRAAIVSSNSGRDDAQHVFGHFDPARDT
ncbi:MAG: uracil-DNA glycosylase family protein [Actinomycetota bacterium]|nr:uracil-DNA glycosylase family protein [Actinomycetota bacterium]